jgi:hypothetical protein
VKWSTPTNWANNAVPTTGDVVVFPSNGMAKLNVNDLDDTIRYQFAGTTLVSQGTLSLNQIGSGAVPDGLIIGDDFAAPGTATVVVQQDHQILGDLTVHASGVLSITGTATNQMTGGLTITGGLINTVNGTLILGGNVTVPDGATLGSIQGHLSLGNQTRTYVVPATSRVTVDLGTEPALQLRSFGMIVTFSQEGVAERAMYFGISPIWKGGHESAGVVARFCRRVAAL